MQTFEALFSFFVLFSIAWFFLAAPVGEKPVNDMLYRYQLAGDVWRVLYLKGDFRDFSFSENSLSRGRAEADVKLIGELTSLCVFIGGERVTNCRGEKLIKTVSIERIVVVDGEPKKVVLSLGVRS